MTGRFAKRLVLGSAALALMAGTALAETELRIT